MGSLFSKHKSDTKPKRSSRPKPQAVDEDCMEFYRRHRPWYTQNGVTDYKALSKERRRKGCIRHKAEEVQQELEQVDSWGRIDTQYNEYNYRHNRKGSRTLRTDVPLL
jgi:hypothetical protein